MRRTAAQVEEFERDGYVLGVGFLNDSDLAQSS
jgi:hypothetical protein